MVSDNKLSRSLSALKWSLNDDTYRGVVVSWRHWTPDFPSIPLGGGDPHHPRCRRSGWRRRSRSGRPLETSRCRSRCRDLHTENERVMQWSNQCRRRRSDLLTEGRTVQALLSFMEEWRVVIQSDVRLTVTEAVVTERKSETSLRRQPMQHINPCCCCFLTGGQMERNSAGSCRSAWCRWEKHWSLRREDGTTYRPYSLCCICSPEDTFQRLEGRLVFEES